MNNYLQLKEKHREESNALPFMFAFSKEQFAEGMKKLGLTVDDTDKIYSIGCGGYIKREDAHLMKETYKRREEEHAQAIANDVDGSGYVYEMFRYELANHEYSYTGNSSDAIAALGLTYEEIEKDERLSKAFEKAKNDERAWYRDNG